MASGDFGPTKATLRRFFKLQTDMEYMEEVAGPRALTAALNRVRRTVVSKTAKKVWEDSKAGSYIVDYKGNKLLAYKVKLPIRKKHISGRIFSSKAKRGKPYTRITGYISPIPLISLTNKNKSGGTTFKGSQTKTKAATPKRPAQVGGIKVGSTNIPEAFLQLVHKDTLLHIFLRKQAKTWRPGASGWRVKPGDPQGHLRLPYEVAKVELETSFRTHFGPTIEEVASERLPIEYDRALVAVSKNILQSGKY